MYDYTISYLWLGIFGQVEQGRRNNTMLPAQHVKSQRFLLLLVALVSVIRYFKMKDLL